MTLERWMPLLAAHIHENSAAMAREPDGALRYPYLTPTLPGSVSYTTQLWDWDSWLCGVALAQVEADTGDRGRFVDLEVGSIRNFLDHALPDGSIPIQISPDGPLSVHSATGLQNMHKPVLAQHSLQLTRRIGDAEWIRPHLDTLAAFCQRYLDSQVHAATGLAYWHTDFAIGVDNDPAIFGRRPGSTASIFLSSLLYRELLALGTLFEETGDAASALRWRRTADTLGMSMREHAWDERDGTFYSLDIDLPPAEPDGWLHSGAPRDWNSLPLRIDGWSSFMPLWAGVATRPQADRMIERYLDPRTFNSAFGIRTLSPLERQYSLRASSNPSNWLGPVWGASNYLIFRALTKYGYTTEARDLAEKTVALFGRDLETSGALHEYYNPETGEPITTRGFANWNFLVLNIIAWLEGRPVSQE